MIAFVDSSVILRKLFRERGSLAEWSSIESAYASRLLTLEVGRVIDRCRLEGRLDDDDVATLQQEARRVYRSIEILAVTEEILDRAAGPMPTVLGSLDAIHLTTALELARVLAAPLVVATHEARLARAARAAGLTVCGA